MYLSLLTLSALCHAAALFVEAPVHATSLSVLNTFIAYSVGLGWLNFVLVAIATFLNSLIFNNLLVEKENAPRNTHLPAAAFIMLCAVVSKSGFLLQNQLLLTAILLFVMFIEQLELALSEVSDSFFAGFFVSLACLINPAAVLLLLLSVFKIINYRWNVLRVLLLEILGFAVPVYLIWTLYFLNNKGAFFIDAYRASFSFELATFNFTGADRLLFIILLAIAALSIISALQSDSWKNVQPRSWMQFWALMGVLFFVLSWIIPEQNQSLMVAILPVAAFFPHALLGKKRRMLRSALFYLLILITLGDELVTSGLINLQ